MDHNLLSIKRTLIERYGNKFKLRLTFANSVMSYQYKHQYCIVNVSEEDCNGQM